MKKISSWTFVLFLALALSACNATKKVTTTSSTTEQAAPVEEVAEKSMADASAKSVAGAWDLTISDTPAGNVQADMVIEGSAGNYKAYMGAGDEKVAVDDFKVDGNKVSGSFYNSEYGVDVYFNMTLDETGNTLKGYMMDQFAVKGKRKMM